MAPDLPQQDSPQRGSAVVEFALVAPMLVATLAAVLQVAFAVHVRDTLAAAAADGAQLAADGGGSLANGVARTRAVVATALSAGYGQAVTAQYCTAGGLPCVEVTVQAALPVLGLLGPASDLTVHAHALLEQP
jgi:Flp pilus assembly protein TadG